MPVPVEYLEEVADRLVEALAVYDRFVDGWPYERGRVPSEIDASLARRDEAGDSPWQIGMALATSVENCYHEAREAEARYIQQARERGRQDWSRIVAETAPVRQAAIRVHAAGYQRDPDTGEPGYQLPADLCPGHHVSMNAGSTPVTYQDRAAQYRAVADRYDLGSGVVYHPGSGHDVSPSVAFPESRAVYVDVDVAAMVDLERAGYEAVGADATGYEVADGADVIIFRNAGLLEEAIVEANLRPGGWVLANDHLASARHVSQLDSMDLVGVVPDAWTGDFPPVHPVPGDTSQGGIEKGENHWRGRSSEDEQPLEPFENSMESVDGRPGTDRERRGSTGIHEGAPLDLYVFRSNL